jgi:hypothetical protein
MTQPADQTKAKTEPADQTKPKKDKLSHLAHTLRFVASVAFIPVAALFAALHAIFVVWIVLRGTRLFDSRLIDLVYDHWACIIVVPFAGYAALAVVILLGAHATDKIEFKALGLDLKGPPVPIVLWVLCFLAIIIAIVVTWPLKR